MGKEKPDRSSPVPSAGMSSLRLALEILSSLILLSHSVKVFAAKWQSIRDKLEELNSGLIATENCEYSSQNTAVSGLASAILVTLNECYDLARRCVDLSYSGKLLMQSDLNVILTKLDRHVKDLSDMYAAGILTHGNALVVSKPGRGACRDDMRFYVRDLLTRMKVGDSGMKRQALVNLYEVVTEDEKYVKVMLEVDDVVNVLLNFLDSPDTEIQEESTKVVLVVAGFDSYKGVLTGAGAIAPLIRVLECGSDLAKEGSVRCLKKLTENSENSWSVSAHGGVTALLKLCTGVDCKKELVGPACGVLRNLIGIEEIKRFLIEEGAISICIKLARSKDEALQMIAIEFLQTIAFGDELIREIVIRDGGIRTLIRVVDPKWSYSLKTREIALRAIESLCFSSTSAVKSLMNYGFVDQLMYYIRYGDVSVQELALKVAFRLSETSEEAKKAMGDAGFMPELVKFLNAKSFEVREMAAEALSGMVLLPKNRKRFVQDDRNIGLLLQLLDSEEERSGSKRFLLSILISLTSCNSVKRKIVNSGYMEKLEKLAQADVSDAKKLVKKLSRNRFRLMLSGIWHS
ncbi:vacuolar protein 8-like isoform X1 [Juglans microcarpa x Juglans regia]|uniref:vacuolar protein 8-like isoform X1 n=1 Tax=Juglans microcarpa x Juglans regia TaxID=2249226 RepID=UPI001B7F6F74|nr:vacuolar protein 8-like isoform X1 [Juglans microcarpa x Juglans regia]